MSAQSTLLTAVRATERGAFEYLPKPFDLNELISVVNRALSAPATPMDGYSTLGAQQIVASGRSVSFVTGIVRGSFAFLRAYVLQLGFLNGAIGFLHAVAVAEGTYYRYMKAWLERRNSA